MERERGRGKGGGRGCKDRREKERKKGDGEKKRGEKKRTFNKECTDLTQRGDRTPSGALHECMCFSSVSPQPSPLACVCFFIDSLCNGCGNACICFFVRLCQYLCEHSGVCVCVCVLLSCCWMASFSFSLTSHVALKQVIRDVFCPSSPMR